MKNLRKFTILLLDDKNGINEEAWNELFPSLDADIVDAAVCIDGRYFIGETDAEQLLAVA